MCFHLSNLNGWGNYENNFLKINTKLIVCSKAVNIRLNNTANNLRKISRISRIRGNSSCHFKEKLTKPIPNPPATPMLFQILALHQIPEMLLERITVGAGECDRVAYGDASVFPGEFDDAQ